MIETADEYNPEQDSIDRGEREAQVKEELATEVKEKIAKMIHGSGSQEVIEAKEALRYLSINLGTKLAALLCSLSDKDFGAYARKNGKRSPTALQRRNIAAAYLIADTLLSRFPGGYVQDWFVNYSDYLWGVPAIELSRRPEDVRLAALHLIAEGVG
jgi:hypothetical protein